jgi:hypothetical protein
MTKRLFYLTPRSAHYIVLHDDIFKFNGKLPMPPFSVNDKLLMCLFQVMAITYCHVYAKATRSVCYVRIHAIFTRHLSYPIILHGGTSNEVKICTSLQGGMM